jgi:hypothetical protein
MTSNRHTFTTRALLGGALAGSLLASGITAEAKDKERKQRKENAEQTQQRLTKQRQVSGTIIDTKTVEIRGADSENMIALIKTKRGNQRLVVDLGPTAQLTDLDIDNGEQIAAQGVVVTMGDRNLLVANQVKAEGRTLEINRMSQLQQRKGGSSR